MKNGINETEYTYICAKIRAMEARLPSMSKLERLIDASVAEESLLLKEFGLDTSQGLENAVSKKLCDEINEIKKTLPDESLVKLFLYQYDCNNVKTLIKCRGRGISADGMLFSCGSVSEEDARRTAGAGDFSLYPENMARAADQAAAAFASTGNPQTVDVLLDRACYLDMLEGAAVCEEVREWIKMKIDITNAMITLRLIRMGGVAASDMLNDMLLDGGDVDKELFIRSRELGESELIARLGKVGFSAATDALSRKGAFSLGDAEKAFDDLYMSVVRKTKFVQLGARIVAAYIIALEYSIKNIRIILAGKEASLDGDAIRGMLREGYV